MNTVFQYVVKFVCGITGGGNVVTPGTYRTAINVYNPTTTAIDFRKNVAVSYQEQPPVSPGPVSAVFAVSLGAGQAVVIDSGHY